MTKPHLIPHDHARPQARFRWCLWLVAAALMALGSGEQATARGALTLDEATEAVRGAAASLDAEVGELPRQVQLQVGTDVHFLLRSTDRLLEDVASQPLAAAAAGIEEDLLFLRDLMFATRGELDRLGSRSDRPVTDEIRRLTGVAEERVGAAIEAVDRQVTTLGKSIVTAERTGDGLVLRTIDRSLYHGVRLAGVGLLLIGLLAVGMRLLALSEVELSMSEMVKNTPLPALGGMFAVGLFLLASATVVIDPRPVAALAQLTEVRPVHGPCERLRAQRDQLLDARAIGHDGLGDAVKDRMRPAAQDCFGLGSQVAAVEAVEWLSTSLDPLADGAVQRAARGTVDAEIERLMVAADPERAAEAGVALADAEPATGGPVEALAEPEDQEPTTRIVETTARVNYRSGPSIDARRLGTLPQGAEVVLLAEIGTWAHIQLEDDRAVYVASAYLRERR